MVDISSADLESDLRRRTERDFQRTLRTVSIAKFRSDAYQGELRRGHNRLEYWARTQPLLQRLVYAVSGRHPPQRTYRLQRLGDDVAAIAWTADLLDRLGVRATELPGPAPTPATSFPLAGWHRINWP